MTELTVARGSGAPGEGVIGSAATRRVEGPRQRGAAARGVIKDLRRDDAFVKVTKE